MNMQLMTRPQADGGHLRTAIDGLLEDFLGARAYARVAPSAPAVDIRETEDELVLYCDLPGVEKQDVQVEVRDNNLVVAGERKPRKEEDGWLRRESYAGTFYRAFALPTEVQAAKVKASMSNGVLEVRLPKAEQAKPHRVTIA